MFPNIENVSYIALLSILLSRFLINIFPAPERLMDGSRCDHIMRMGLPYIISKFIVSKARSAKEHYKSTQDLFQAETESDKINFLKNKTSL